MMTAMKEIQGTLGMVVDVIQETGGMTVEDLNSLTSSSRSRVYPLDLVQIAAKVHLLVHPQIDHLVHRHLPLCLRHQHQVR